MSSDIRTTTKRLNTFTRQALTGRRTIYEGPVYMTELGPLPKRLEVTKVLANAALQGSVIMEAATMTGESDPTDALTGLRDDAETEEDQQQVPESYDVRNAWPAGQTAPNAEPQQEV